MWPYKYASVDIETTGLNPENCQVIQFGIILDDLESDIETLPAKCWLVRTDGDIYQGQPFALQMNAEILKQLSVPRKESPYNWCRPVKLVETVKQWLKQYGWEGEKLTFAGKNFASFDKPFLMKLGWSKVFQGHRSLDPGSMYWRPSDGGVVPSTEECAKRAGITLSENRHTAVADALDVVKLIRKAHAN